MADVELLSPAGDFDTARAAFAAGADAVYCGLSDYSARAFAKNLSCEDLARLVRYAHARGRKVFVTFNTVVDEDPLDGALETLARLDQIRPDALIVQDLGVARLCRRHFPKQELHASTQLVAHNLEGVLALRDLGFRRVVLARELTLGEISAIALRSGALRRAADGRPVLELECFIHGALCYSLSGLCLFSAVEKGRSGNRGQCAYCCRLAHGANAAGESAYPFSMKDLRLGEEATALVRAGVTSLKIEGRMKSALYVASVTKYYRQLLDAAPGASRADDVTRADLETVFSRRTTPLYLNGRPAADVLDTASLGHLGAEIGTVKRVTRDREGRAWLRFHTARALERHDGLQFGLMVKGRHPGLGISEMRTALSRQNVFEVCAGTDVEILLENGANDLAEILQPGVKVYCSMSNAVKRRFPVPSYRPADCPGDRSLDVTVTLAPAEIAAEARGVTDSPVRVARAGSFSTAQHPERTRDAVAQAFARIGETAYAIGQLDVADPDSLFAPKSVLNDLRRDLVAALDAASETARERRLEAARAELAREPEVAPGAVPKRSVRLRAGQVLPPGAWDEVVVAISADTTESELAALGRPPEALRLALPVFTAEGAFAALRHAVKRFLRAGYARWEVADLATLRLVKGLGVTDITADWTLYAFNSQALAALSELGVTRFVASPENGRENVQYLAESGYPVAFLAQQSTPLFISLTKPGDQDDYAVYPLGPLWITTRFAPRTFDPPSGAPVRVDLSWDPPVAQGGERS